MKKAVPVTQKTCFNPNCQKPFVVGHYGERQKVGSSAEHVATIKCGKCRGSGQKLGVLCHRCGGKGKVKQSCQEWYKTYWSQTRRPPRGVPPDVFAKLEKAARPDRLEHACLVTARESGLRKGELLGLTWSDIVDPAGKIRTSFEIRGQWDDRVGFKVMKVLSGKIGYFLPAAVEVVKRLSRGEPQDRVFPFYESAIYDWFIALQEKLGLKNPETGFPYRWHDLRHALGVELVHGHGDKGLSLAKEILGHANIQTTTGYSQKGPNEILAEVAQMRRGKP